jgi:acetyl esterase/lipase
LDLYLPDDEIGVHPLIVWVHGGAWLGGDKENPPVLPFVSRGYAAASINYRLSQQAIFPAQIHDCKAAIRFIREHAPEYHLDADHIGVWGHSAGGHLVALLGTSGTVSVLDGPAGDVTHSSCVQAVADYSGPADLSQMSVVGGFVRSTLDHDAPDSPESRLIGGPVQEHPDKVALANPVTYARTNAPPFLIVHGVQDAIVPMKQAELLYAALCRVGASAMLRLVGGAGHDFHQIHDPELLEQFFDRHLRRSV